MPAEPQQSDDSVISRSSKDAPPREQPARRSGDALRVSEMTGVLIGDDALDRTEGAGGKAELVEIFRHVAHARGERDGAILPIRIVAEELTVFLER